VDEIGEHLALKDLSTKTRRTHEKRLLSQNAVVVIEGVDDALALERDLDEPLPCPM
jgi:hypothetical protein